MNSNARSALGQQIQLVHERVRQAAPDVLRVAVALYEPADDLLTSFINSTIGGVALQGHEYRLRDCPSLSRLAETRTPRLLTDLPSQLNPDTTHSAYVLAQGYLSSFTVPMVHRDELLGFVFFDSRSNATFTPPVVRELILHAGLLALTVANELIAVSSVLSGVQLARDFTSLRDFETGAHMDRIGHYVRIVARDTARHFGFDDEVVAHMRMYAPLHDIGKIGVPDHILLKPAPLDPEEWEEMKRHTVKGGAMIAAILRDLDRIDVPEPKMLRNIVELHHEKLDGSGYPYGLHGDEIPFEARIITVADIFDALTGSRPYKPEWHFDEAIAELRREADMGQVDGHCVEALAGAGDEVNDVRQALREALA